MVMGSAVQQDEIKQDMTPMIDVVFQLMIFFMCTIKFKSLEGKLTAYLPKDVGVHGAAAHSFAQLEKVDIVIKVLEEGTKLDPLRDAPWVSGPYRYGPDRKLRFQVGSVVTSSVEELSARLKELHLAQPERAVAIDPRAKPLPTTYADMVLVLNVAVLAGFQEITFKGPREY